MADDDANFKGLSVEVGPQEHPGGKRCSAPLYLLVASAAVFLQTFVSGGLSPTVITTLELRFGLSSVESGAWGAFYDVAAAVVAIPIAHRISLWHKPRTVGFGVLLSAVGSFLVVLPFLLADSFQTSFTGETFVCDAGNPARSCEPGSFQLLEYICLCAGQVVLGVASVPLFTAGVAYMDEAVSASRLPVYLAVFYSCTTLGPAAGFVLGGSLLDVWEDLGDPPHEDLDPEDTGAWVGAWWAGFAAGGIGLALLAIPVCAFPRYLPNTAHVRTAKKQQAATSSQSGAALSSEQRRLWPTVKRLARNPVLILASFAVAGAGLVVAGVGTFLPKFVEVNFQRSPGDAAILAGIVVIPGAVAGTLFGGWFVKRCKFTTRQQLLCVTVCVGLTVLLSPVFLFSCGGIQVDGTSPTACNSGCACPADLAYTPVCGGGVTYFSGCAAGCAASPDADTFTDCACVAAALGVANNVTQAVAATGVCSDSCSAAPFLVGLCAIMFIAFSVVTPLQNVFLRSVPFYERETAIAVNSTMTRLFGVIWGPILLGALLDGACDVEQDTCNGTSSCVLYDADAMQVTFTVFTAVGLLASFLLFAASYKLYKVTDDTPAEGAPAVEVQLVRAVEPAVA